MKNNVKLDHIKINALIRLVEDPDKHIYKQVRSELVEMGSHIIPSLEMSWTSVETEHHFQERVQHIIRQIQVNELKNELLKWKDSTNRDLLRGSLIISKFQFPEVDDLFIEQELDKIKQKVWLELSDEHTAFEIVKIFNHVLFDLCGFQSTDSNINSPQNSFLNTLLESKKGNQLSLSILYSIIAQKLEIPIYGINLPHNFVLGFMDEYQTLKMLGLDTDERNVLFYINPFSKGRIFNQNEIENYLRSLNLPLRNNYFEPCSNTDILKRLMNNLSLSYTKGGDFTKVDELSELLAVLD
ncbi:transglutaminase-like domain-containing protein [Crocinitomix catalasitica]|uniref:transglutaminase-like domain-containing protein n=1 Tax=Crocinitomix catalasitica TaxID=184607 RepID=UPI000488D62B|nr:transglutaminase-like domain-containing protein [Crocinitomix catalasitica]